MMNSSFSVFQLYILLFLVVNVFPFYAANPEQPSQSVRPNLTATEQRKLDYVFLEAIAISIHK